MNNNGKKKKMAKATMPKQQKPKPKPKAQARVQSAMAKIGAAIGANLGSGKGKLTAYSSGHLSRLVGSGSYSVVENSIMKTSGPLPQGEEIPKFSTSGRGTRIVHREYVGDIISNGAGFTLASYALTPVNSVLFPWMSTIAALYQQYKFNGAVFEFKSMCSEYAVGAALGTVIMSTNYNANLPVFDSKMEMENTEFAVSAKPSLSQVHCIECDPKERVTEYLYVQPTSGILGVNDNRLTSFGNFQLATSGLSAPVTTTIGELWISYDITFLKPVLNQPAPLPGTTTAITTLTASVGCTNVNIFGSAPLVVNSPIPSITYNPASANTITVLEPGVYLAYLYTVGSSPGYGGGSSPSGGGVITNLQGINATATSNVMARLETIVAGTTFQFTWSGTVNSAEIKVIKVPLTSASY